ncbi:RNA methyltransferase [uncultured Mailhella sp.]|uniref:RNA methyltransferase n=1 Tax=uncultured Mailhella sp. TaxID=1981031 RepID=UPI002616BC60|nr:RNA methyltransferase [uncultured Mailhella sp.]
MTDSERLSTPIRRLRLVLVRTNFPENIGMAARASANFGHAPLYLAAPRRWNYEKALLTATSQGQPLLDTLTVTDTLQKAVAPCTLVVGTTARTGGARRQLSTPRQTAREIAERLTAGEEAAIVFGPEDRGLSNEDLENCGRLVTIPTAPDASSLNLAQSVLLMMYECCLALPDAVRMDSHPCQSRRINAGEREILFQALKDSLMAIGTLPSDNPEHFFLPLARFFDRADVRRHEMDIFMGICRQMLHLAGKGKQP